MRLKSIVILIFLSSILFSCTLIRESRNRKKLANIEYERVYTEDTADQWNWDDELTDSKQSVASTPPNNTKNTIWYHPNPWWRIETTPFPVSKDSIPFRMFFPQYGYPNYYNPTTQTIQANIWQEWLERNHLYFLGNPTAHIWNFFISANKETFQKHPEYLAEINGERLGYGKVSQLCVTNNDVQKLFIDYIKSNIQKTPKNKLFSVEPSDGGNFCTCKKCSSLGSTSNKVYYFTNIIAKEIYKSYPDKELALVAYYTHADTPSFSLEKNIRIFITPNGFQSDQTFDGLLKAWSKKHSNLGLYDYLGIPQWKAEQPRIIVHNFYRPIEKGYQPKLKGIIYEASTNINASIIATLLSKTMMNPDISWEMAYNKFLNDCFPNSKDHINRLFSRWHQYDTYPETDITYSIYDLDQAYKAAKSTNEQERIRDLKAYLMYQIYLIKWNKNRDDVVSKTNYFDYIYNTSHRNIIHTAAILQLYGSYYNNVEGLNKKYEYRNFDSKTWIKFLKNYEIDNLFESFKKEFPPMKVDYLFVSDFETFLKSNQQYKMINNYTTSITSSSDCMIYVQSSQIEVLPTNKNLDSTLITIYNNDLKFYQDKLLRKGESLKVQLPKAGIYYISIRKKTSASIDIRGEFIPILKVKPTTLNDKYSLYSIQHDKKSSKINFKDIEPKTAPYYIIQPND